MLNGTNPPKELHTTLKLLSCSPEANDAAYRGSLSRIREQLKNQKELANQVLLWLTFAKWELTILEPRYTLTVRIGECDVSDGNLPDTSI